MHEQDLSRDDLDHLVQIAVQAVEVAVLRGCAHHPDIADHPPRLAEPGAVFVTLRRHGRLRGCIGSLVAIEPLVEAVADRARMAALHDPRFEQVQPGELDDLEVSVSVLSAPLPMDVHSYHDLLAAVRPGVDGLVVEAGHSRATLLPSVWEELPHPEEFLAALWRKAGLTELAWPHGITVSRYTAQHAPAAGHEKLSEG
jgi:hypothetical protein